jgi:hypothetical protein
MTNKVRHAGTFEEALPKTVARKEYPLPKWDDPYDVVPTRDASEVWLDRLDED